MMYEELIVLDVESLAYSLGVGETCDCGELAWCGPDCPSCGAECAAMMGLYDEPSEGN